MGASYPFVNLTHSHLLELLYKEELAGKIFSVSVTIWRYEYR